MYWQWQRRVTANSFEVKFCSLISYSFLHQHVKFNKIIFRVAMFMLFSDWSWQIFIFKIYVCIMLTAHKT